MRIPIADCSELTDNRRRRSDHLPPKSCCWIAGKNKPGSRQQNQQSIVFFPFSSPCNRRKSSRTTGSRNQATAKMDTWTGVDRSQSLQATPAEILYGRAEIFNSKTETETGTQRGRCCGRNIHKTPDLHRRGDAVQINSRKATELAETLEGHQQDEHGSSRSRNSNIHTEDGG
ncbi:UNVERIFIED_CONTAM: hypothetical protein PYX00_005716 [Menopon gallinae]|uniref:Uncharacterized protein n=1 Tax=Menopon gallinae TaxID=328185 RepID=A0AAW2HSH4_9NEOP